MRYLQDAFDKVCSEAKQAKGYYVCLMERVPYYGGPEEGGWWGSDTNVVAYQYFATEEQAEAAKDAVVKLAEEMGKREKDQYGRYCLQSMEWLEARGLDADYLPEPDGPNEYYVTMSEGLPTESRGCRHYE